MRVPNPWVAIPIGLAAVAGAGVGFFVTTASCAPQRCLVPAVAVAVAVSLAAATGVGVVVVLALRSLGEFRETRERDIVRFVEAGAESDHHPAPVITEAGNADADAIAAFLTRAWDESEGDIGLWGAAAVDVLAAITDPDTILSRLDDPSHRVFIAAQAEGIVGLAEMVLVDRETARLSGIVVLAEAAGSGIGSPILELAVSALTSDGFRRVTVATGAGDDRAIGFYTDRGFRRVGTRTEEISGAQTELAVLERNIGT